MQPPFKLATPKPGVRTPDQLFPYQVKAIDHQCSMPNTMLWLDMGLGKTVITLTTIEYLIRIGFVKSVIIVAPIRVCKMVWRQEAKKWAHTNGLSFSLVTGDKDMRTRAMMRPAQVYLINYENLGWLSAFIHQYYVAKGVAPPFDGIVWDEVSKMKNSTTQRVKQFKKIAKHFKWTTGLTGTPASNGYKDLHGQYLVVDGGKRLGEFKTPFRTKFYHKVTEYKEVARPGAEEEIKALISDITLEMSAADYNPLPDMIVNDIEVEMTGPTRELYERLEKDYFTKLDSGEEVEVFNEASLQNKLFQVSNGAVIPFSSNPTMWVPVHDLKLDALEEILDEAQGQPVLCAYSYRADAARIMERFKHLNPINLTECKSQRQLDDAMKRWKDGGCALMIGHPQSMGHGIDGLQDRGHILAWYGLTWSLDLYEQMNARIRRQGQGRPVMCHRIMIKDTLDQAQAQRLNDKDRTQTALRNSVKQYRLEKGV